jgi:hypothetical protein
LLDGIRCAFQASLSTDGGSQGSTVTSSSSITTTQPSTTSTSKKSPSITGNGGLTSQQAEELLASHGRNELPEKHTPKWKIFFYQLIEVMRVLKNPAQI